MKNNEYMKVKHPHGETVELSWWEETPKHR